MSKPEKLGDIIPDLWPDGENPYEEDGLYVPDEEEEFPRDFC